MSVAIITGSGGLIGSEAARHFAGLGFDVVGVDNDMRATFFGPEASTTGTAERLGDELGNAYQHVGLDIRDREGIARLFETHSSKIGVIVHAAAQPSHDWAAREPHTDFGVNAVGTLNVLEAARASCPDTPFIFTSTNKVYGDTPNFLPLEDQPTRLGLPADHPFANGVTTEMTIDRSTHSLFGVSKVASDLLVQEYGRYFDMPTVAFRCGCLTGPAHAGTKLHGFLSYLMRCTITGAPYTIFGYAGKQVRDNIHSYDVVRAFESYYRDPRPAAVYNLGGGPVSNVSMLEAIEMCQRLAGRELQVTMSDEARVGDHRWWISDLSAFSADYPDWQVTYGIEQTLQEIHDANVERWGPDTTTVS